MQMMMHQAECVAELLKLLALFEVKAARCRVLQGPARPALRLLLESGSRRFPRSGPDMVMHQGGVSARVQKPARLEMKGKDVWKKYEDG